MKFLGSKARIAKSILPIILKGRKRGQYYVEPMVGGCNSMQYVKGNCIGADANPYLIAMWKALQEGRVFPDTITKSDYVFNRELFKHDTGDKAMVGWVGFMASFNGRFFDGGYSGHDVKGRNYIRENINNIYKQLPSLKDVEFVCAKYRDLEIPPNSIIYVDPPYKGTKEYVYKVDHEDLWEWCREMKKEGHVVYVSEYNAPKDFKCVWAQEIAVAINPDRTKHPIEKLFRV